MNRTFVFLTALAACTPSAHLNAAPASALSPSAPAAERAPVATTLSAKDPLEAPHCELVTAPFAACPEAPAMDHSHHHGHHGAPSENPHAGHEMKPQAADPHAGHEMKPQPAADPHAGHEMKPNASPKAGKPAAAAEVKDPICGMTVDPEKAGGGSATVGGKTYYFCSSSCRRAFLAQQDGGTR